MATTAYTAVDLSKLPAPSIVEALSFESIFSEMLADLQSRDEVFTALVESDPAYKILEVAAYRELLIRQRVNESAKGMMLAYASGSNLDQIAANFNVERLVVDEGDDEAVPPIPPTYETDDELRKRVQLSFEALSAAGPESAYIFHSLAADADVKDVGVSSPNPGEVVISVLSREGDGTADETLLDAVEAALNDDVRPLTDDVTVQSATIVEYTVEAELTILEGPDSNVVLQSAIDRITAFVDENHKIGRSVNLSGVYAALHVAGVENVDLTYPAAAVEIEADEAPYCTSITVTVAEDE